MNLPDKGVEIILYIIPIVVFVLSAFIGIVISGGAGAFKRIDGGGVLYEYRARQDGAHFLERMERKLRKLGAEYHGVRGGAIGRFFALQLLCGTICFMIFGSVDFYLGFPFFVVGLLLPWGYLYMRNVSDNRLIAGCLLRLYRNISNLCAGGLTPMEAIEGASAGIRMKRFNDAFDILCTSIKKGADVVSALAEFKESFECEYIESFCITMLRVLRDDTKEDGLCELYNELSELTDIADTRKEMRVERTLVFYLMGMLMLCLLGFVYAGIIQLLSTAVFR